MDLEPDPPPIEPPADDRPIEPVPSSFELLARGMAHTLATPVRVARLVNQSVRQGLTFLGFQRQATPPAAPFQAPRTSFNTDLTPHRRFAYTSVPLEPVREIKRAFNVKVNDVVLALCAGALRRYLLAGNELPSQPLIAQVPVSLRSDGDKSDVGTKVGAMFASLATNVEDPVLRLLAIHQSTQNAKEMRQALAADKIMGLTEAAPPSLISLAARMYTAAQLESRTPPVMNLIISNVPGPSFPIYCAGAKLEAIYPMGPLLYGTGVNVTVFSYLDKIDFGFMMCRERVRDGWFLAEGIPLALEELSKAAAEMEP
jgi:WS/DGAT/MGAT family acyltransferase